MTDQEAVAVAAGIIRSELGEMIRHRPELKDSTADPEWVQAWIAALVNSLQDRLKVLAEDNGVTL